MTVDENTGEIAVPVPEDVNPGDKIVVIINDKDGNEIDRVTVPVEDPATDGNGTQTLVPGDNSDGNGGGLAQTGAELTGVAGIAAGFGLALTRRRRAGEEG